MNQNTHPFLGFWQACTAWENMEAWMHSLKFWIPLYTLAIFLLYIFFANQPDNFRRSKTQNSLSTYLSPLTHFKKTLPNPWEYMEKGMEKRHAFSLNRDSAGRAIYLLEIISFGASTAHLQYFSPSQTRELNTVKSWKFCFVLKIPIPICIKIDTLLLLKWRWDQLSFGR